MQDCGLLSRCGCGDDESLEVLVERAAQGSTCCLSILLERFQPLIQSYIRFATQGHVNRRDNIMCGFARAYGASVEEGAQNLRARLLARNDIDDIKQEITVVFLETVKKRPSNLQYAFRRDCVRRLGYLARSDRKVVSWEDLERQSCQFPSDERWIPAEVPSCDGGFLEDESLWVLGLTCGSLFEGFSCEERQLLVDIYLHRLDEQDLEERYGASYRETQKRILERLRERAAGSTGTD